jgi:pimeloyl-ACP methyl ester carboxylesterase
MTHKNILFALAIALFLTPVSPSSFAHASDFSDLNGNGTADKDEAEVIVNSNATLPAGDYEFNNLVLENNAVLVAGSNPNSSNDFKGVKITATNLTVSAGSSINADAKGDPNGPGTPPVPPDWGGASYGGAGEHNSVTSTYGSAMHPTDLGSGADSGGAVRIISSGILINDGMISANTSTYSDGSGGSVFVTAGILAGAGSFSANGGHVGSYNYVGAGGGGRVAVYYQNSSFAGNATALGGTHFTGWGGPEVRGGDGTVVMEEEPTISLVNASETEDDGIQDQKGVADKTEFTFSVTASEDLIDIKLVTDSSDIGINPEQFFLYALGTESVHSRTLTFPQGHYHYHFEAGDGNGGIYRYPETTELEFTTGYSNVAFLPGIKASRLYQQGTLFENQLWEPNRDGDTRALAMNQDGTSEDENIYTKTDEYQGTIDQANILPGDLLQENFYVSFLDFMNEIKENGEIADWKALPYDWRLAFPNILNQGNATVNGKIFYDNRYATDTPYILQEIRRLAETSDTGKVTIIGHSMGGMLAKKLLIDNQDIAISTETLILVDSPQLGTPQAIATMLHGTKENIPESFGFFSDAETGRKVAQNMPSVYTLLPSLAYTERVKDEGKNYTTLISQNENLRNIADDPLWNTNSILDFYQTKYGTTTITAYDGMKDFLGGTDGHSSAPDSDIVHPKRIQMDMLAEAQTIHDEIDNWVPPAGMRVVQIAGWGIPDTIRGIEYKAKTEYFPCAMFTRDVCSKIVFDTAPMFTFDGDGTVVVPSQIGMATTTEMYFVDLNGYNNQWGDEHINFQKNRSHGSILEVENVRTLINNLVKKSEEPGKDLLFIKTDQLHFDGAGLNKKLIRLSLHSPIKVDVTDQNGNHIGISASSTPERTVYDTQMPNSYYLEMGEGKYLGFQLEASTTIQLQGTGTGTFTLNLEQYQGDTREGTQTFTDIPVNTTTKATLVINTLNDAKELALDQDGNGTIDSMVFTDENKETVTFQTLKNQIQTLTTKTKPVLLVEVAVAEKQFNKGNYKATKALLLVLKKEIETLSKQKIKNKWQIEKNDALRLFAILDALMEKVDKNIIKK